MRRRLLTLRIDPSLSTPLSLQIVEGMRAAIQGGDLVPGEALPSTRALAESLNVSRSTVLEAYAELTSEGLVEGRQGSGSYVVQLLPQLSPSPHSDARNQLGFDLRHGLPDSMVPRSVLSCLTGQVDPRVLPAMALARSYRKALNDQAAAIANRKDRTSTDYLRTQILHLLEQTAALGGTQDNLLLTGGLIQALSLLAGALIGPGDVVAVEALGARTHWEVFRQAGASLVAVPVDAEGLCVEEMIRKLEGRKVRAVMVTPRCQYPTTVPLAPDRRRALLAWARSEGVAILEVDREVGTYPEVAPPLPLAAEDRHGSVVYVGAFPKALFPGLPLAFIHAPSPLVAHMATSLGAADQGADPVFEGALANLFIEGEFHRHLARLRTVLKTRRHILEQALDEHFGRFMSFTTLPMGLAFWCQVTPDVDVEAWSRRALTHGVAFTPGGRYAFEGAAVGALRLGFASHREDELVEIVHRMAAAL